MTHARVLPGVLGALALLGYALFLADNYALRLLALSGINALLALGYQFVFGLAGALSLAQAAFFGIGAYAAALLATRYGLGLAATLPAGMLGAAAVAWLAALPIGRLGSHYFALASLGIAQLLLLGAVNWETVTGGANGLAGIAGVDLLGWPVPRGIGTALLVWSCVALACLCFASWRRGLRDAAWHSLRETPRAAAAVGLDGPGMRLKAFIAGAACGGAAGVLQAHVVGVVSPDVMSMGTMIFCLAAAVIGGRGTATGAVIGALLLTHLPEWFRFLEQHALTAYGIGLLLAIVLAPDGLVGLWNALLGRLGAMVRPAPPASAAWQVRAVSEPGTLVFDGTTKRFGGVIAADDVSLTISPGEIVGLIGPNGAGKTTLLNIASGAVRPDAGSVTLAGAALPTLPPHRIARLGLARTFQTSELAPGTTTLDAVALAVPRGSDMARRAEAAALLEMLGVARYASQHCGRLPPGPRRLVEVARALAGAPKLLLLDEPAAGLDPAQADRLVDILRRLPAAGVTVMLVEHDIRFLGAVATRLVCLDQGRIVADGPVDTVLHDPAVLRLYLGAGHA